MAEIVNLRQARKRAARDAAATRADANRTAFGLPKQLRAAARAEKARAEARHAGSLREGRAAPGTLDGVEATDGGD